MWRMEDVLSELSEGENIEKGRNGLPPGFRFHPTDEELITFYLASKVFHNHNVTTPVNISEVDLNRCEPWDLPARYGDSADSRGSDVLYSLVNDVVECVEGAKMGEKEWYLYSLRDRKYPTGLRTNRATGSGYWKATGKDRQIHAANIGGVTGGTGYGSSGMLIGMKKTLVFYQGRAPRGVKTHWVMHEYRLDGHFSSFRLSSKEEWVICRIFHKHGGEKKTSFHQPPPLSPFLRCLPPLLDVPTTSSSSTTKSLKYSNNNDSNSLLQSLLSNPLPNFSSLNNDPTTLFTPHSATGTNAITSTTTNAASIGHIPNSVQLNLIPERFIKSTKNEFNLCDMNDYVEDNVAVGFDMSSSVAALDRLLNPHHANFSAESWPFHH